MLFLRVRMRLDLVFCTREAFLEILVGPVIATLVLKAEHVKTETLRLMLLHFVSLAYKFTAMRSYSVDLLALFYRITNHDYRIGIGLRVQG